MKKLFLLTTIFFNIGILTYSVDSTEKTKNIKKETKMNEISRTLVKELTSFYGGYDEIYSNGIKEDNIYFLINEIKYGDELTKNYDFTKLTDGEIVKINLDQGIELSNVSKLSSIKIIGKPNKNANVDYKKSNDRWLMFFSSIGEYQITFTDKYHKTKVITFVKSEEYKPALKNIKNNIEDSYKDENQEFLNENIKVLKAFFPDSELTKKGLFYSLELNEKSENYESVRVVAKTLVSHYRLKEDEKIMVIKSYLNALKNLGKTQEYLLFLEKLSAYDSSYEEEFITSSLENKYYSDNSFMIANHMSIDRSNSLVQEYLGDYFYSKENYEEAIIHYKAASKTGKLAIVYLEINDKEQYELLKKEATKEELEEINQLEIEYRNEKELEKYLGTAEKYVIEDRLQEAELYYKKLLKKDISPEMRANINYKLVDLYYNLENYKAAKLYIEDVDIKFLNNIYIGEFYYLGGMVNYNLHFYDESIEYFNKLIEKYPDSPESNRGKIYIYKINKMNKK